MTNSFPDIKIATGIVTLLMTVTLVVLMTLVIIFTANNGILQDKMTGSTNRGLQASSAADAGMEFSINYLKQNKATILAGPVNGYISYTNSSLTNIALANSSKFSVTYSNPVQNNFKLIKITSTGTSDDGSATHTSTQLVYSGSLLSTPPTVPLTSKGTLSIGGSSQITNTASGTTVQSASSVSISGSGKTVLASGTSSTSAQIKSDIQQNVASLSSMSKSNFFASYFGMPSSTLQSLTANQYSFSTDHNYSSTLNGMTGTSIWISQTGGTATINGSTVIGSAANPVLLIINGNLSLSGNITIYGFVYVSGDTTTSVLGSVQITGSMVTADNLTMSGSTSITYSPSVISSLQNQASILYYAKVPGSWKDF